MVQKLEYYKEIIPEYPLFLERICKPVPVHLRINELKVDSASLVRALVKKGVILRKSIDKSNIFYFADNISAPGRLFEYFLGHFHPQTLTSCLASMALCPEKGAFVLDMCAAPGGKTAHLAQIMENTGLIVANELFPGRHISLGNTIDRLGVLNTVTTSYQAQQFPLKESFDYILADVPCSGEGTLRGEAFERYDKFQTHNEKAFQDLQKKIILRGFDLLKKNGEMLYSTCTYNPDENEGVVDFLLNHRNAELLPIPLGIDHDPGIIQWKGRKYDSRLKKTARFYPHRIDSVGFFMARIGRK